MGISASRSIIYYKRSILTTPADHRFTRLFYLKWWAAFFISSIIVVLATLPPFLPAEWSTMLMMSFSKVCHQIPDRTPRINGVSLAVCHRCYGVYLGLPLAMIGFVLLKSISASSYKLRVLLFASLALLAIDWGAPLLGLWHNIPMSRMGTGLLFGLIAGFYLGKALLGEENQGSTKT